MTWSPRPVDPDEFDDVIDLLAVGFGVGPRATPDHRAEVRAVAEIDRSLVVEDAGRIVATAAAHSLHVALPRGGAVPMAGVTEVVVAPTHRRRGLLTALIEAVHDQATARGEPLAGLTASEGGIYRRFGYGVAVRTQSMRLDAHRSAEVAPVAVPSAGASAGGPAAGSVRLVDEDEAAKVLPAVWDLHWRRVPGELDRTPGFWDEDALDPAHWREGASARYIAVHEDGAGRPDGFVTYRIAQNWGAGGTNHEARVLLVAAVDDAVEATLRRFVADIDLVGTVTFEGPVDATLRWRLADPRALTVTAERDMIWFRPLDVAACLTARGYAGTGELVLDVVDDRRDAGGRFLLSVDDGPAGCARTARDADVRLSVAELGSLLAGGTTWATLARAGRIDERRTGAVDRADALFRPERAAWCATEF